MEKSKAGEGNKHYFRLFWSACTTWLAAFFVFFFFFFPFLHKQTSCSYLICPPRLCKTPSAELLSHQPVPSLCMTLFHPRCFPFLLHEILASPFLLNVWDPLNDNNSKFHPFKRIILMWRNVYFIKYPYVQWKEKNVRCFFVTLMMFWQCGYNVRYLILYRVKKQALC